MQHTQLLLFSLLFVCLCTPNRADFGEPCIDGVCYRGTYSAEVLNIGDMQSSVAGMRSRPRRVATLNAFGVDPTETCNQAMPSTGLVPGMPIRDDTFGSLIANQQYWRLPGLDALQFGVDILSGQQAALPLFLFCYPNSTAAPYSMRVQDAYRGNVYLLPSSIFAEALPTCSYSMSTRSFSSSQEMAATMMVETSVAGSVGAAYSGFGVSVSAKAAFSQESSVSASREAQSKAGGSIIEVTSSCSSFRVSLASDIVSFHPTFYNALYEATDEQMLVDVMSTFGTYFMEYAELGGKLTQVISTESSFQSSKSEDEQKQAAEYSFSASAGGWGVSAEASASYSSAQGSSATNQQEFESASSKSDIITYGGAPGSFGPSAPPTGTDQPAPANWGAWAATTDLLPVPIKYRLKEISLIIPPDWKNKQGNSILDAYKATTANYYQLIQLRNKMRQLGDQNIYFVKVTTGDKTVPASGPYSITLHTDNQISSQETYLTAPMLVPASKRYSTSLVSFNPNRKTFVNFTMPDLTKRIATITLCSATSDMSVAPSSLSDWGLTELRVDDMYRGITTFFSNFNFPAEQRCVEVSPTSPANSVEVYFQAQVTAPSQANYPVVFTIYGTSGEQTIFTNTKVLQNAVSAEGSVNLVQPITDSLGAILSVFAEMLIPAGISGSNVQDTAVQISPSYFMVTHTFNQTTMMYQTVQTRSTLLNTTTAQTFYVELV